MKLNDVTAGSGIENKGKKRSYASLMTPRQRKKKDATPVIKFNVTDVPIFRL